MEDFFSEQFADGDNNDPELAAARGSARGKREDDEGQLTVDVYQTDDEIVIRSTIAGVTAEDLDISVTNDMVTIKGSRKPSEKIRDSDYYYQELYWGPFSRAIILPEEIDSDNAKASMKNGILTIRMPKLARSRIKKVRIVS
jgi:HSP20 family protein